MAWIYFRESVELALRSNLGCEQSHIVKLTDIVRVSYCLECNQATLIKPQYAKTCEASKEKCCQKSTSSQQASPAKTSALLEAERDWQEGEAACFLKLSGLQKKFDRVLFSLKMSPPFAPEDWSKLSRNLPKFGMIVGGRVLLPQALELSTKEKGGFCSPIKLFPTPLARDWKGTTGKNRATQNLPNLFETKFGKLNPSWIEWLMGYPSGWTELNLSATRWFHYKHKRLSKGC